MRLTITIDLDNAAFADDGPVEVGRILSLLERTVIAPGQVVNLYDLNGNKCGEASVTDSATASATSRPAKWHGDRMD